MERTEMKKLMIPAVAGLVCGLALLAAPAAHAQGEIETLWAPSQPVIERVDAGDRSTAAWAVTTLFDNMLCASTSQNHYVIGQRQGQYLVPIVLVPPTQMQSHGKNAIYFWGQALQGRLKGAQVAGLFTQIGPGQIDALLRLRQTAPYQTDVTVHFQMKLIYQKPKVEEKWDKGGTTPPQTGDPKQTSGNPTQTPGDPKQTPGSPTQTPGSPGTGSGNPSAGPAASDDIVPLP
jgi:hypothetical protein